MVVNPMLWQNYHHVIKQNYLCSKTSICIICRLALERYKSCLYRSDMISEAFVVCEMNVILNDFVSKHILANLANLATSQFRFKTLDSRSTCFLKYFVYYWMHKRSQSDDK